MVLNGGYYNYEASLGAVRIEQQRLLTVRAAISAAARLWLLVGPISLTLVLRVSLDWQPFNEIQAERV